MDASLLFYFYLLIVRKIIKKADSDSVPLPKTGHPKSAVFMGVLVVFHDSRFSSY